MGPHCYLCKAARNLALAVVEAALPIRRPGAPIDTVEQWRKRSLRDRIEKLS